MKRTTQASSTRNPRHSDLRTQSQYALIMPEARPNHARTAPPSPTHWQRHAELLHRARATASRLAEEVKQKGGTIPRRAAIEHYLHAMALEQPTFTAADPTEIDYLFQLRQELNQEVGPSPRIHSQDADGRVRSVDRIRGRELLLRRWDRWSARQREQTPRLGSYLASVRQRFVDGITGRCVVALDDWPMHDDAEHAALHSLMEQVIEPAMDDMEWNDIDKQEVGLLVRLPAQLRGTVEAEASDAGHHPEQTPVAIVGEQVQQPVRAFANVPDTGIDVGQEPLLPHEPALFEHQP